MLLIALFVSLVLLPLLLPLWMRRHGTETGAMERMAAASSAMALPPMLLQAMVWSELPNWAEAPLERLRFAAELKWDEYVLPIRGLVRLCRTAIARHLYDFKSVALLHYFWDGGLIFLVYVLARESHGAIGATVAIWLLVTFVMALARDFSRSQSSGGDISDIEVALVVLREFAFLKVLGRGLLIVAAYGSLYYSLSQMNPNAYSKRLDLVDSLYFSVVTAGTIGYGDITPQSAFSKFACCSEISFGFVYVGLVLSSLMSITQQRGYHNYEQMFAQPGGEPTLQGN